MRLLEFAIVFLISFSHLCAFAGGNGSSSDPYQVSTLAELQDVENYPDSCFILIDNIDATETQTWNSGEGFEPIGGTSTPFTGMFDGQGYTISNLFINIPGGNNRAMFSYTDGATISNLVLVDFDITGDARAAALVAYLNNSTVTNCGSSGAVSANSAGGGLIGRINASTVISCYSIANVTGRSTGENFGGLVGITENTGTISNCYARGDVNGYNTVGGLVGKLVDAEIAYCYSTGEVTSTGTDCGGLAGYVEGEYSFARSYWDMETSLQDTCAVGAGKTTDQMKYFYMYHGNTWDFVHETQCGSDDYWDMDFDGIYNDGYPYLAWQDGDDESIAQPEGSGNTVSPYLIEDLYDLFWISANEEKFNRKYRQTADIDARDTQNWNNGAGFCPIGDSESCFAGIYDGADHQIDSLFIDRTGYYAGFFGNVKRAEILNMRITNVDITGDCYVGGLAGIAYDSSSIKYCSVTGSISGGSYTGGVAGRVDIDSQILFSCSNTDVSATFNVGGICGFLSNYAMISNCYCAGSSTGNGYIGGCVGRLESNASISYCYSLNVLDANYNYGGFLGSGANNGTVTSCFWDTEVSQCEINHGGTGLTTAEMQAMSTYTDAGWDFVGEVTNGTEDIWIYFTGEYPDFSYGYDVPEIVHVDDVAGDQGHQIDLLWKRCSLDVTYSLDYFYSVWRLVDDTRSIAADAVIISDPAGLSLDVHEGSNQILLNDREDYWTFLMVVPATMNSQYSVVLPTLVDSSASLSEAEYTSTYKVLYHFDTGYLDSESSSGYSIDNIAPYAATGVTLAFNATRNTSARKSSGRARTGLATLSWNEVNEGGYNGNSYPEQNGVWYRVYAGDTPDFPCDETTLLGTTQDTSINVDPSAASKRFFKVVVSDQP